MIGGRKVSYGTQQNKPLSELPTAAFEAFFEKNYAFFADFFIAFFFSLCFTHAAHIGEQRKVEE